MAGLGSTINKDVIKKYQYKLPQVIPENIIHQSLEGSWSIGQAERHD
jgi:hypothetical protein